MVWMRRALLWVFGLAAVLAACGGEVEPTPVPPGDGTLVVMAAVASSGEEEVLRARLEAFNAAGRQQQAELLPVEDVGAQVESLRAGASGADVVALTIPQAAELMRAGVLAPLEGGVTQIEEFLPAVRERVSEGGHLYCAPRTVTPLALIWNKARFADAGVGEPNAEWTWDSLRAAAEALTELEQGIYGIALNPDVTRWLPFLVQAGGALTDEGRTLAALDTVAAQQALEFYTGLGLPGYAQSAADLESQWAGEAFGRQRVALIIEGSWIVPWMAQVHPEIEYGVTTLPVGPVGRGTLAFATCYAVPLASQPGVETLALVDWLVERDALQEWAGITGLLPARKSAAEGWVTANPAYAPFYTALAEARVWDLPPAWRGALAVLEQGLAQIPIEEATVPEVLAEAQAALQGALDGTGAPVDASVPITVSPQSPTQSLETGP